MDKDGNRHIDPTEFENLYADTEEESEESDNDLLGHPLVKVTQSQWEEFLDEIYSEDPDQDLLDTEPMEVDPPAATCEVIPLVTTLG